MVGERDDPAVSRSCICRDRGRAFRVASEHLCRRDLARANCAHRLNGPAVFTPSGDREYWVNGQPMTQNSERRWRQFEGSPQRKLGSGERSHSSGRRMNAYPNKPSPSISGDRPPGCPPSFDARRTRCASASASADPYRGSSSAPEGPQWPPRRSRVGDHPVIPGDRLRITPLQIDLSHRTVGTSERSRHTCCSWV